MRLRSLLILCCTLTACVANDHRRDGGYGNYGGYPPPPGYGPPPGYYRQPQPAYVPTGPIAVARATYGTWKHACDATGRLARQAAGRYHAAFVADNTLCGDPHQGKDKTLSVDYYCGGVHKSASAGEGHTLHLSCP